jgi:hypothetical protein
MNRGAVLWSGAKQAAFSNAPCRRSALRIVARAETSLGARTALSARFSLLREACGQGCPRSCGCSSDASGQILTRPIEAELGRTSNIQHPSPHRVRSLERRPPVRRETGRFLKRRGHNVSSLVARGVHPPQYVRLASLLRQCCYGGRVPPVRIVQPTHGRDARATTV